jgi:death-on-curing protein
MRYLTVEEVQKLHQQVLNETGGGSGVRDQGALEAAVAQPQMTFGGQELYSTLADKAGALGFSLAMNHAFVDGNKRTAHAAMEVFLVLNGAELDASVDEQEKVMLELAAGNLDREAFVEWIRQHLQAMC